MKSMVKLINQEGNHNKYYFMNQVSDQEWVATYGRIGSSTQTHYYPMAEWDKKYREKAYRHGYKDVSEATYTVGLPVRTPDNMEAIVIEVTASRGTEQVEVQTEKGRTQWYEPIQICHAYVNPELLMHKIMYPNLCALYMKLNGVTKEGKKSVAKVLKEASQQS